MGNCDIEFTESNGNINVVERNSWSISRLLTIKFACCVTVESQ